MCKKIAASLVFVILLGIGVMAEAAVKERYIVTPGVDYQKEQFYINSQIQMGNRLNIDLTRPEINVGVGIPNPLNSLDTVSSAVRKNTNRNQSVVGAINASFFHFSSRLPAYLLVDHNRVSTFGVISTGSDEYMSIPTAFGVKNDGTAQIDTFQYNASYEINGIRYPVSSINKQRGAGETVIYTPNYSYSSTRANRYGMEIVVSSLSTPLDSGVELGKPVTGIVQAVRPYGNGDSVIPKNGYVISVHGTEQSSQLAKVRAGDRIALNIDMESKWRNSKFILASGPMLVKNGKVDMTINPNSSRAKSRNPRTAVAVDRTGKRVFFVTVDGRNKGKSNGMTLSEFAQYLVSIGAYQALNLDGGGSTTMVARPRGYTYPKVVNSPSDQSERRVSAILQVLNTSPKGEPVTLDMKLSNSKVTVGSSVSVQAEGLDSFLNKVTIDPARMKLRVEGNIGRMNGNQFMAERPGTGFIIGEINGMMRKVPITVIPQPMKMEITPSNTVIGAKEKQSFQLKVFDGGKEVVINPNDVRWWATNGIGAMQAGGILQANDVHATGKVQATYKGEKVETTVHVVKSSVSIDRFENSQLWTAEGVRADAQVEFPGTKAPYRDGKSSLLLNYHLKPTEGTAAAYAVLKQPVALLGLPKQIGLWVYGDGKRNWLRGQIIDGDGKVVPIDFTENGGLDWNGWKYVRAEIPSNIKQPIKLSKIYVAQTDPNKEGSGQIYLDKLQAEYDDQFIEPMFEDVLSDHWAKKEVEYLASRNVISGYENGLFKPETFLTRAHAAVMLMRVLDLPVNAVSDPGFKDVTKDFLYFNQIAAVENANIMKGNEEGTQFNPNDLLTRGQMAAILARAYELKGETTPVFKDVPVDFWAFSEIQALASNQITTGYPDKTFKPNNKVTRAQFSAFLYRILTK
ncbi:hypothetical protein J2S13_001660 [Oikeobacillus pervagus]|uniref:SLH domain-containing protein n=1 Tax=Oikeobacillus pervagus TaxID=1325931 RepID=A0AAJ1SYP9_9BACI|nr:phosphodiester glycosidase family protein [Oikeobacillus pervagus]MDQ0215260.1 hypothetical protein [Oikeobacillus pervagus]